MAAVNRELETLEEFNTLADGTVVVIGVGVTTPDGQRADLPIVNIAGEWFFPGAPFPINPVSDLSGHALPAVVVYER